MPPMPSPDPSAGLPEIPPVEWLVLRWAEDRAVVRLGGDETGCVAQVWRLARVPYTASGTYEATGEAMQYQVMCFAGGGGAQLGAFYFAPDGLLYSISAAMPLEVGSHPVDIDTEVNIGQAEVDIDDLLRALFSGDQQAGLDEDAGESFFPSDAESGEWQGSVEVTGIDPLVGEMVLQDMRDERGRSQELRTGFRCDLPPGQLARAAEEPADGEGPSPSPAPVGSLTIDIASGPNAGSHQIDSSEIDCSFNLFGDDKWFVSYAPPGDPVADELQALTVSLPQGGGESSVFMLFGDDIEQDWFDTDDATGEITDAGNSTRIEIRGRAVGTDFNLTIDCGSIERF